MQKMTIKAVFCFISKKGYLIIKEIIIIPGISFRNLDAPEANTHQTFKRSHYWKEASEQYVLSLTAYHSNLRPPEMASDREYMYFFYNPDGIRQRKLLEIVYPSCQESF